jgi:hypothetical protein
MGTVTITAAGFATLPVSAPATWPATVTYPSGGITNGTKVYTITDADWQKLINWAADSQFTGTVAAPATPTAQQILLAWVNIWANGSIGAVKQYFTTPATPPAPIVFT